MNQAKTYLYKGLKLFFYLAGFPLLLVILYFTTETMRGAEVMGNHASNWLWTFVGIWAGFEILRFVLMRFVGRKSDGHKKLVTLILACVCILAVILPTTIFEAVDRNKFETAKEELGAGAAGDIPNYDYIAGWHRGFTGSGSQTAGFIGSYDSFKSTYGLSSMASSWYGNADKENNLGYKIGVLDKMDELLTEKRAAVAKLAAAEAELATVEADYAANLAELENPLLTAEELKALRADIAKNEEDLVRLKGFRIDISAYKEPLVDLAMELINDLSGGLETVFPDGIDYEIYGINIGEFEDLIELVLPLLVNGGVVDKAMLMDLIPDVIYTGIGDETVATYEGLVYGTDSDWSLRQVEAFSFKMAYYPATLTGGAVKYVSYICVGLVLISFLLSGFFSEKEKQWKGEQNNGK